MAGIGKRMRPHTLTIPKPLLPIAGKPIVQRLVEGIAEVCEDKIEEIAFIIGEFGKEVENNLLKIADDLGAKGRICYQEEALDNQSQQVSNGLTSLLHLTINEFSLFY